jgi:hypothetical protein
MPKHSHRLVISSPTNVDDFPTAGWAIQERPIHAIIPGQVNDIIGFDNYYFLHERVLCTRVFSITAVATTINDSACPPGSTEHDDKTGHSCQIPCALYSTFCALVLGLPLDSWEHCRSETAFCNMLLQDLDAILCYEFTWSFMFLKMYQDFSSCDAFLSSWARNGLSRGVNGIRGQTNYPSYSPGSGTQDNALCV